VIIKKEMKGIAGNRNQSNNIINLFMNHEYCGIKISEANIEKLTGMFAYTVLRVKRRSLRG